MIFIIDNELFALAVINLLKILLRTWSYFRILLKSSSYDPERVIDGLFFHARNVKKLSFQVVVCLKLRARLKGSKIFNVIDLLLKRGLDSFWPLYTCKSPSVSVNCSIFPFHSASFCFICLKAVLRFILMFSLCWFFCCYEMFLFISSNNSYVYFVWVQLYQLL